MSASRPPSGKRSVRSSGRRVAAFPKTEKRANSLATVSRPALLDKSGDRRFRQLVYDLLTIATRVTLVRDHLGRRMKLSGPQYSVLMAVLQLEGDNGVGVSALARLLHVSTAFIATETGKLVQRGLLAKRQDPKDGRAVLLTLTRSGRSLVECNGAEICAVNDVFFGSLDAETFELLTRAMAALVQSSDVAIALIGSRGAIEMRSAAE